MVVLVDFKTKVQIQVGTPKFENFLKPFTGKKLKKNERFELERVLNYFESLVKEAEKPIGKLVKKASIDDLVKPDSNLSSQFKR
jgi:hypothetical protein